MIFRNIVFIFSLLLVFSCGKISPKGEIISKDIPVEDFTKINLKGKFRVFYVQSPKSFVNVETYPNISKNLTMNVDDKILNIVEKRPTQGVDFYNITIYSKLNPEKISVSDSVEMNVSGRIKTDNFRLNLKNYAKFIGAINSRRAEVQMEDKSRANFSGFTKDAVLKISDTASLISPYWELDNLNIDSRNGTYTEVFVKDSLKGKISNTAKMVYYKDPIRAFQIDKTAHVQNKKLE